MIGSLFGSAFFVFVFLVEQSSQKLYAWHESDAEWCTNLSRCLPIDCAFADVPSAGRWKRKLRQTGHRIAGEKIERKTGWIRFVDNSNHNEWSASEQMRYDSANARWTITGKHSHFIGWEASMKKQLNPNFVLNHISGCRPQRFSACHLCAHLALARPTQKRTEACQILSVRVWFKMWFGVCKSVSLWAGCIAWYWSLWPNATIWPKPNG